VATTTTKQFAERTLDGLALLDRRTLVLHRRFLPVQVSADTVRC
jgi:hypothetical protein